MAKLRYTTSRSKKRTAKRKAAMDGTDLRSALTAPNGCLDTCDSTVGPQPLLIVQTAAFIGPRWRQSDARIMPFRCHSGFVFVPVSRSTRRGALALPFL